VRRLFNVTQEHMMNKVSKLAFSLCLALGIPAQAAAQAQDPSRDQTQSTQQLQTQERDRIYGSELMTPQERAEYQNRMRELRPSRSARPSAWSTTRRCRSGPRRRARPCPTRRLRTADPGWGRVAAAWGRVTVAE
jgi:hypothetical protein